MYKEPPYLILVFGSWIHHYGPWSVESPDVKFGNSFTLEGTSKCVANSIERKIHASPSRRIPLQSSTTSPKRQGREGMQPGDVVWVANVGEIFVRNPRCAGCKRERDARAGSCVERSQHMYDNDKPSHVSWEGR